MPVTIDEVRAEVEPPPTETQPRTQEASPSQAESCSQRKLRDSLRALEARTARLIAN